jgi:CCR4-NOT transcriptional regulation complex NOT5 subunit
MRNKRNTIEKLEAQATKLNTLKKRIENSDISGSEAVKVLELINKDLMYIVERLELEYDER